MSTQNEHLHRRKRIICVAWFVGWRFERAMHLIRASDASLADIAFDAGYADQPHLTRDFQALAGASPRAYRQRAVIGSDHAFMRDED